MADASAAQRIVPGAPPPAPLSKSQKKKRKSVLKTKTLDAPPVEAALALTDAKSAVSNAKIPEEEDIAKSAAIEELIVQPAQVQEASEDKPKKPSLAIDLLNKRIKAQTKKLSRIAVYSSKPSAELNEDQLKSLATLPAVQGAVRELEETRKAIEALEAEQTKELERRRAEEEQAVNDRIAQAISENTRIHRQRLLQILTLLRLSSLLSSSDPTTFTLIINEKERQALYATAAILLGSEGSRKEEVVDGFLHGDGNVDSVDYGRMLEIVESHQNPPPEGETTSTPEMHTPEPDTKPISADQDEDGSASIEPPADPVSTDVSLPVTLAGSFHFMQESELDAAPFEHGAEWVEKPRESEIVAAESPAPEVPNFIDTGIPLGVNGVSKPIDEPPLSAVSAALDWAADDAEGLPPINSLHAKFGTSGDVTPEADAQDAVLAETGGTATPTTAWKETPVDNAINEAERWGESGPSGEQADEDGFVKAKSGRGRNSDQRSEFRGGSEQRGRGRGNFRGDRGGESRGGHRGRGSSDSFGSGWRAGEGEFRGRGGFRGDRGRGGEFRGRGRGGEFRGRGRGDRGGHRGGRGGVDGNVEQGERQSSQ